MIDTNRSGALFAANNASTLPWRIAAADPHAWTVELAAWPAGRVFSGRDG